MTLVLLGPGRVMEPKWLRMVARLHRALDRLLTASGWVVALAMAAMGAYALVVELPKIWQG